MTKLKAAVVGAGIYGSHHMNAYKHSLITDLVAVCDFNKELGEKRSREYNIKHYTDLQQLIDIEKPDVISIVTPDPYHYEPTKIAIENGIHVLVEKPLTIDVKEAEELLVLAKKHHVRIAVDFHKRWDPAVVGTKLELEKSDTGRIIRGYMSMDDIIDVPINWLYWSQQSSPAYFLGVHCYDVIRFLSNQEVHKVFAVGQKGILSSQGLECYDSIQAMLVMEDGSSWTVDNCWTLPNSFPKSNDGRATILTENKFIRIDSQDRGLEIFSPQKTSTPNSYFISYRNGKATGFGIDPIDDFAQAIRDNTPFIADDYDGIQATKIAVAVHKSLETQKIVTIGE